MLLLEFVRGQVNGARGTRMDARKIGILRFGVLPATLGGFAVSGVARRQRSGAHSLR